MRKIFIFSSINFLLFYFVFVSPILAQVPKENRMILGEISEPLPVKEMRSFYTKMEPLMLKIFGPPFSNINLKIKANAEGTVHDTGFIDNEQALILAGQAKDYLKNKDTDSKHALEQIYGSMLHELSHAQYYYGKKRVNFHPQWVNEGWAKLSDTLLGIELAKTGSYLFTTGVVFPQVGTLRYFRLYLDSDTVAGTKNWGSSKQNTNHGIVYDITTLVHLTLISAASTSNENLDFFKTFNNTVYNWIKSNNKTEISFEEYKDIMRQLLQYKTVDGESAFDWYFSNPDSLINGNFGNHLGVVVEPGEIVAYAFRRVWENNESQEKPISGLTISVKVKNYLGNEILNEETKTDIDGNVRIPLPKIADKTVITINALAKIEGKDLSAETFYFNAPSQDEKLYGVLVDENRKLLPAKYVGLLQVVDGLSFNYKNRGVFELTVPFNKKTVQLDFLGYKQEINKGPWTRVVAIKIPAEYVQKAVNQPESVFKTGLFGEISDTGRISSKINLRNPTFSVGVIILGLVTVIGAIILKKS